MIKKVLARHPNYAMALNFLGYIYALRKIHLKKAQHLVEYALQHEPRNPYFFDSLGWIYFQQKRYKQALLFLKRAYEKLPREAAVIFHMARIYAQIGRKKKALALYRKAQRLRPPSSLHKQINAAIKKISLPL